MAAAATHIVATNTTTTALSWNKELNLNTRRRMIKDFLVLNVYGMAERKMIPPKSKEE